MKPFATFFLLFTVLTACTIPPGADDEPNAEFTDPQNVFDGRWLWLQTKGVGIAGPYVSDSTVTGYSWKLVFSASNGPSGLLETYKSGAEDQRYLYSYTVSSLPSQQKLLVSTAEADNFLWEIKYEGEETHLYLRNIIECCDNSFEHHFLLIDRNHY